MIKHLSLVAAVLLGAIWSAAPAAASVSLTIGNVVNTPAGGSFEVVAAPDGASMAVPQVGAYSINLEFSNFLNGIGSPLSITASNLLSNFDAPSLGSQVPGTAGPGTQLLFTGVSLGAPRPGIPFPAGQSLMRVDFTVPGGFTSPPNASFDVNITATGPDPLLPTAIDSLTVNLPTGASQTIAVPEPSSFLFLGLVGMLVGGVKCWLRRNKKS